MRRVALLIVLLGLGAAACSSGNDGSASDTSVTSTTTTTLAPATTTTTAPPAAVPTAPITIPSKNDGSSANGSGCAPPAGEALPDGIWFGDLKAVDVNAGTVSLDLNCFFTGDAANHAAAQDGQPSPVEDDYYIRNKVKKVYVLPAQSDVAVFELSSMGGGPLFKAGNGLQVASQMLSQFNNSWIGWLQIAGGKVIAIQQQFVP